MTGLTQTATAIRRWFVRAAKFSAFKAKSRASCAQLDVPSLWKSEGTVVFEPPSNAQVRRGEKCEKEHPRNRRCALMVAVCGLARAVCGLDPALSSPQRHKGCGWNK
jgi:hypothetical protein